MDDIVERLRTIIATPHGVDIWTTTALEAADEIERLRQEVDLKGSGLDCEACEGEARRG